MTFEVGCSEVEPTVDPIMVTAATTLVAWTTNELAQGGRLAVTALIDFLRDRFRREPEAREVIEGLLHQPSPDAARPLAELLDREAQRDPAFGAEFQARWKRTDAAVAAGPGGVANSISGDVSGPVVQARDVHGGISFG
ncbi:hypothetical protein OOK41_27530 [Micromonospora sp. NBC_01655]|uniref:hypothetical protein n=1 Tax=unclassified Micromonospora TaxID=2617518 RepID=UPI000E43277C|nr:MULTISPECIES: hypothetical protein [unclassified Micromonospora]MCX4474014.1 hypothetical protein [Micromonospora sp. NBC_01655]